MSKAGGTRVYTKSQDCKRVSTRLTISTDQPASRDYIFVILSQVILSRLLISLTVGAENPDHTGVASLGSEDIDWETFEDIESYVTNEKAGWLGMLLPNLVWEFLFAPTTVDQDILQNHRQNVVSQRETLMEGYESAQQRLITKSNLSPTDSASVSKMLSDVEKHQFPIFVMPRTEFDTLNPRMDAIDDAISREQELLRICEQLLTTPEVAFLREEERAEIAEAQEAFRHSIDSGLEIREKVEQRRQDAIERIPQRLPEWQQRFDDLEARAEPYLVLDEYLSDNELIEAAEALEAELVAVAEEVCTNAVSHPKITEFNHLKQEVSALSDDLRASRDEFADARLEQLTTAIEEEITDLEAELRPAIEQGQRIDSSDALLSQISRLRQKIQQFQEAPWQANSDEGLPDELSKHLTRLNNHEAFIDEKIQFDEHFAAHAERIEQVYVDAAPYLEYQQYLTRTIRAELSTEIETITSKLNDFIAETQFELLSTSDRREVTRLKRNVALLDRHLADYNQRFVEHRRATCASFFNSVGPTDASLTDEQERAVVRNGTYNQVVAAAGTGKTLTLTTRIAYLIKIKGIDPSRILAVTYTSRATEEMETRLSEEFGITDVEIETVHAFGRSIIQDAQDTHVSSIDDHQKLNIIDQQIRAERTAEQSEFLDHYFEFLVHYDDVYYAEEDFKTKKEYIQARMEQTYTTLRGEDVKSRAEKLIADFLFTHQVEYQYEDMASWAETAPDRGEYSPDFYLPRHNVYIEHWGIDEDGEVAPWFSWSSEEYRDKIRWARNEFAESEHSLIGTYEFEHEADQLKEVLRHRLTTLDIDLDRMSFESLVEDAFEYNQREGWIKDQFVSFIENARMFELTPDDITATLSAENPRQYHFAQCGIHLLQQYMLYLTRNDVIDYTDMIHDAVALIQEKPAVYRNRYDHILVDEFQDIAQGKLELIQGLTGPDAAKLFAVGDDWQSIFSFQGAVVEYFTNFAEYFDKPVRTDLTANFRSPSQVVKAGNQLIQANSNQLEKTVRATIDHDANPKVHELRGYSSYDYLRRVRQYTVDRVQEYIAAGADPSEIMILCRFDGAVQYLDEIKQGLQSQGIPYVGKSDRYRGSGGDSDTGVSVYSVYQAKGGEANHVVLVHAASGPFGFPPEDRDNELLDPVQPLPLGGIEEERRAFYVAITRTKQTLDLLTRGEHRSEFLDEISDHTEVVDTGKVEPLDDVGETMSVEVKVNKLLDPWTKQHQRGFFEDKYGGSARFVSWENSDPVTLDVDEWYSISGVKVSEYQDEKELVLGRESSVTRLQDGPHDSDTQSDS